MTIFAPSAADSEVDWRSALMRWINFAFAALSEIDQRAGPWRNQHPPAV
jgi:hypothetical protein